jgi:hypothetical protein
MQFIYGFRMIRRRNNYYFPTKHLTMYLCNGYRVFSVSKKSNFIHKYGVQTWQVAAGPILPTTETDNRHSPTCQFLA